MECALTRHIIVNTLKLQSIGEKEKQNKPPQESMDTRNSMGHYTLRGVTVNQDTSAFKSEEDKDGLTRAETQGIHSH